jgi:hypothetical protein
MAGRDIIELVPTRHAVERAEEYRMAADVFEELLLNPYHLVRNPTGRATSHRLIGRTLGGRCLVLPVRATDDGRVWLVVTVWPCDPAARRLLP